MSYWFYFMHPDVADLLPILAEGSTYCRAKAQAFDKLEAFLTQTTAELPKNGWSISRADRVY